MIRVGKLCGKAVAVMGLGKSGFATARALRDNGADALVWDDNPAKRHAAAAEDYHVVDLATCDWRKVACLVWSPGIPHTFPQPHKVAVAARAAGVEPVCDVDLLARAEPEAAFIGITGTNGKSTTTALIGHILATSGRPLAVGGNLGMPVLDFPSLGREGTYVVELSSYQLELVPALALDVAVLLNITPDHLGRHGGMNGYVAAKTLAMARLRPGATAIIGVDDDHCRAIAAQAATRTDVTTVPISALGPVAGGVYLDGTSLVDATGGAPRVVMDLAEAPTLPGRHNGQNAAAAYAAARARGMDPEAIRAAMRTFPGLPHRQELVATVDGVRFVNDSKATNADAAEKAMTCYEVIYWIVGGQAKEGGIEPLRPLFPRVRHAFLIGEAEHAFAATLDATVPYTRCGTLTNAVARAAAMAKAERIAGAVVLLAPACASWDQFASFEARGTAFRAQVEALASATGAGR